MKKTFGLHCHLLKLNSIKPTTVQAPASDPEKQTNESDESFSIPSSLGLSTSPEKDTTDNPRIRDIWTAQMSESDNIRSRLLSYLEPRSPRSSSSTVSFNTNATSSLTTLVPSATLSTSTLINLPNPTHSRSTSNSALTMVSSSYSSISTILATSETPLQTPLQTPTTADGFLALHDPKDGLVEPETGSRSGFVENANRGGLELLSDLAAPVVRYGQYLSEDDVEGMRTFVKEMVQSIIPYMERNMQHWNEQVASARRGLTGRIFGASRRFFASGNKSPSPQSLQNVTVWGPNSPPGITTISMYGTFLVILFRRLQYLLIVSLHNSNLSFEVKWLIHTISLNMLIINHLPGPLQIPPQRPRSTDA